MKNIHVLPSDKPSRLFIDIDNDKLTITNNPIGGEHFMNQNIYITNSEEIKEGNYGILGKEVLSYHQMHKRWGMPQGDKIILTDNQDLIKDGVQAIDDEFLEWFVKNSSCESVGVEESNLLNTSRTYLDIDKYKIIIPKEIDVLELGQIIPKEEPKTFKELFSNTGIEPTTDENGNVHYSFKANLKEEPKQETLEEVAERLLLGEDLDLSDYDKRHIIKAMVNIAKWQKERSYSEEEVELIANEMVNWAIDNIGNPNPQSGKKFDEVIAKFKNK